METSEKSGEKEMDASYHRHDISDKVGALLEPHKRGLNTKIRLAVDAAGMPVRVLITEGTRADSKEAVHLRPGL